MSMISEQVKGLRKLANQWKHNDVAGFNLMFDACDTIEALSAKVRDADRPTGEWICMGDVGVTECNQCGWSIEEYVGDYKFCPNCGAKMRGEEE